MLSRYLKYSSFLLNPASPKPSSVFVVAAKRTRKQPFVRDPGVDLFIWLDHMEMRDQL